MPKFELDFCPDHWGGPFGPKHHEPSSYIIITWFESKKSHFRTFAPLTPSAKISGLFSSIVWEQWFDRVHESSRTLELFEQFDVQFRKWRILLVSEVILVQNMLVLSWIHKIYYVHPYTKDQNVWRPSKAFSCISDYNFGPNNSKKGLKVRRTFNSSRTAFLGFVKVCESSQTRTFDRTPNWTTLKNVVCIYGSGQPYLFTFLRTSAISWQFFDPALWTQATSCLLRTGANSQLTHELQPPLQALQTISSQPGAHLREAVSSMLRWKHFIGGQIKWVVWPVISCLSMASWSTTHRMYTWGHLPRNGSHGHIEH